MASMTCIMYGMKDIIDLEPMTKDEQTLILVEVMKALTDVSMKYGIRPEMVWESSGTQMVMKIPIPRLKHTGVDKVKEA